MKATDFNVHNIKKKYNFNSSDELLKFLYEQLKMKEETKADAQKLIDELDFDFCDSDLEGYPDDFKEFIHNARKGAQKRLNWANTGISAIKQDIQIVKNSKDN